MALRAKGLAAAQYPAWLPPALDLRRHFGQGPPRPLSGMSRASGPRRQPDRLRDRQSKRKECRKRGAYIDPSGYDAGKKIKGKKRHILVDTLGLLMHAVVHAADIQDRDGGALVMAPLFGLYPFLLKLYADGGYQGCEFQRAVKKILARVNLEIVRRSDQAKGFLVLP